MNVESIEGNIVFMMTQKVPAFEKVAIEQQEIASALGLHKADLMSDAPLMKGSTGQWWLVVGVKDLDKLLYAKPNMEAIKALSEKHQFVGVLPFCLDTVNPNYDFHLRAFCPIVGINEDPVCGTGSGCAAAYIAQYKLRDFDTEITLIGEAGLEVNRPGKVYNYIEKTGDTISTIKVGGSAVTTLEGKIHF